MKIFYKVLSLLIITGLSHSSAQTFTMGKKCRSQLEAAQIQLESKNYEEALSQYMAFSEKCRTKDAKEAAAVGKSKAYNELGQYDKAIAEADNALKITKNKSLEGHFQKAVALNKKGDIQGSKVQLKEVIRLTEMNEDTKARASNFALMSAMYERQLGQRDSAMVYLNKAKDLDPTNVNYMLQEGDLYLSDKNYDMALKAYDNAASLAPESKEVYIAKTNAHLIKMSDKYGTSNAQALRKKMTSEEKTTLCKDLKKALNLGWKDMNKDMFAALVCK